MAKTGRHFVVRNKLITKQQGQYGANNLRFLKHTVIWTFKFDVWEQWEVDVYWVQNYICKDEEVFEVGDSYTMLQTTRHVECFRMIRYKPVYGTTVKIYST